MAKVEEKNCRRIVTTPGHQLYIHSEQFRMVCLVTAVGLQSIFCVGFLYCEKTKKSMTTVGELNFPP